MENSNYRILVVDDDDEILWIMKKFMESNGYNFKILKSGKELCEILLKENFDLILLDINMPELTGIDVMKFMKENNIKIETIIISAYENVDYVVQTIKLGAYDYLIKPIDEDRLKLTIENCLGKIKLQNEIANLKDKIKELDYANNIITNYDGMKKIISNLQNIAKYDISVLIIGESGTGKELIARYIHENSHRKDKPFISIDCATLPENLFESELFGYEKGAFTGAIEGKIGRLEMAYGGTLFLDEVGNLSLTIQKKLLRVLQEKKVMRIGGKKNINLDFRIISATNVNLVEAISKGEFREDLYHRLNEILIELPPLRERIGDINILVNHFIDKFNKLFNKKILKISDEALRNLNNYKWSGNVRELENCIKQAVVICDSNTIESKHLPKYLINNYNNIFSFNNNFDNNEVIPLKKALEKYRNKVEKEIILKALNQYKWNKTKVAEALEIDYKTLYNKMKEYGIEE